MAEQTLLACHLEAGADALAARHGSRETAAGLEPTELHGSRPRFGWPLRRMLVTRRVGPDLTFRFTRSTKLGDTGYARKR